MRVLFVIILLTSLVLPFAAFAETQTFTATHTYVLGDDDSRNSARQKCLAEAKRKILERVGVYLESKSELITSSQSTTSGSAKSPQTTNEERQQITEQINTLAAGVLRSEVIKEEFGEVNGRYQMTLTIKAEVDPDDVHKQLAARRVDQGVRKQVAEQAQRLAQLEEQLSSMMMQMRSTDGNAPPGPQKKDGVIPDIVAVRERAIRGDAEAQNNLGFLYFDGRDVPQDYAEARQWWERAASQGNATAQVSLGVLYESGRGVPQDYAKAREWYEKAAAKGNAWAQSNLGSLYSNGQGVPQDKAKARQWYEKAAAQGNAVGQFNLGWQYHYILQDYAKARQWYEKAAEQGLAQAQHNLGLLYANGQGVPQDYATTWGWYEKAAAQGNTEAQDNLGWLYANGKGVPTDYVKAYMWWSLAVAHSTGDRQKHAANNRDEVAVLMTPSQIALAKRLTQQCQTQQFKGC